MSDGQKYQAYIAVFGVVALLILLLAVGFLTFGWGGGWGDPVA